MAGLMLTACSHGKASHKKTADAALKPVPHNIVVLLDKTASVKDQNTVFKTALKTIIDNLKPGDKFRLAEITGESSSDFNFDVSLNLPPKPSYNMLTDNEAEYKEGLVKWNEKNKSRLSDTYNKALAILEKKPTAMQTDLFGAIYSSNLYLSESKNRNILVILSDMIEEDSHWRFQKVHWTEKLADKIIAHEKSLGLLSPMKNVCVYVIGARGPSLEITQRIRQFWTKYFHETQADFSEARYAHNLMGWHPDTDCHQTAVSVK